MEFPVARNFATKIQYELGTNRIQGVHWKHAAILCLLILVLCFSFPVAKYFNDQKVRQSAILQAEEAQKKGDIDLALRHLDGYLAKSPDDIPVLEMKAKILAKVDLPKNQLLDAARALDQLVRLDPKGRAGWRPGGTWPSFTSGTATI